MNDKNATVPDYVEGHGLLKGRSVLITAAAGAGIGFAAAKRAIEEGCRAIMISDIHERRLNEAADKLHETGGGLPVHAQMCNVTREDEIQALVDAAEEKLGGIDVLINNAGMGGFKRVVEMTDEEWNLVLDVTLNGTMRMTRAALKKMMPRKSGAIVNRTVSISSPMPRATISGSTSIPKEPAKVLLARRWRTAI
jgi:3-oxoacyl-[acyl-carrier protein] reductase